MNDVGALDKHDLSEKPNVGAALADDIDATISVGTIFSVLRCPEGVTHPEDAHFLQPGTTQVAAGYCIYGPSTMLVLTIGHGTHAFTLDREQGSFVLTQRDMRVPAATKEFAINMSNMRHWAPPVTRCRSSQNSCSV